MWCWEERSWEGRKVRVGRRVEMSHCAKAVCSAGLGKAWEFCHHVMGSCVDMLDFELLDTGSYRKRKANRSTYSTYILDPNHPSLILN